VSSTPHAPLRVRPQAKPAKTNGKLPKLGTLQVGALGDVTIVEIVNGPVESTRRPHRRARHPRQFAALRLVRRSAHSQAFAAALTWRNGRRARRD
jgi:predicted amidohydrolase